MFDLSDAADSGLGAGDALLLRFSERTPPSDYTGNHPDAVPMVAGQEPALYEDTPPLVGTLKGRARTFAPGYGYTIDATATPVGAGDVGVAAVVWWDFDAQAASGADGVLIVQGAANTTSIEVRLEVVDPLTRIGRLRLTWWDSGAGAERVIPGAEFAVPTTPFLVCASRELIGAPAGVACFVRLYAAGVDFGTFETTANIAHTATSDLQVGCRFPDPAIEAFFCGHIDALHVVARPISAEEAELLQWTLSQAGPAGYSLARDLQPSWPGAPGCAPIDPASIYQRELMVEGAGHALARRMWRRLSHYCYPDRAWGCWLRYWELLLGLAPRDGDSLADRRQLCVTKLRSVLSMSVFDLLRQLGEALGFDDPVTYGLVIEYQDEYDDPMTVLVKDASNLYQSGHAHTAWLREPGGAGRTWTVPGGGTPYLQLAFDGAAHELRYQGWPGQFSGPLPVPGNTTPSYLRHVGAGVGRSVVGVQGDSTGGKRIYVRGEIRALSTPPPVTPASKLFGVQVGSIVDDDWLWVGLIWTGAQYDFVSCKYVSGVLDTAFAVHATNVGAPARFVEVWHLGDGKNLQGQFKCRQASTVPGLAGATQYTITGGPTTAEVAGYGVVSHNSASANVGPWTVRFGAWWERAPDSERHTNLAVYRDPTLPGPATPYDILLANEILQKVMLADRGGTVIDRQTGLSYANVKALMDVDPLEH